MRLLGALLAGGKSSRFGRDKTVEHIDGKPLILHAYNALAACVEQLVICGRPWEDLVELKDRPEPGLGPLGGLSAALIYAQEHDFDAVLCSPADILGLTPQALHSLNGSTAAVFQDQHLIGYWPASYAAKLDVFLASGGRAVWDWINLAGARHVMDPPGLTNINTPDDLKRLAE